MDDFETYGRETQGVAYCRNQIRKNNNVIPHGHPHRCRSRLNQSLTGPNMTS